MPKCCMRMKKIKSFAAMKNTYEHNYRIDNVGNADPNKYKLNEEMVKLPDGENYADAFRRKISESKYYETHDVHKKAIMGIEVMLTYNGREDNPLFNLDEWKKQNMKFLNDTFGKDNVVSVMLHRDEGTPHIHAVVIPMIDGKLRGKRYMDGKLQMSQMQTSYAKYMKPLGLERGMRGSGAKHEDIQYFYKQLNEEMSKELPEVAPGETAAEYRRKAQGYYTQANVKNFQKIKELTNEVERYSGSVKKAEYELEARERSLDMREKEIEKKEEKKVETEKLALQMRGIDYALEHCDDLPDEIKNRFGQQAYKLSKMGIEEMIKDGVIEKDEIGLNDILENDAK